MKVSFIGLGVMGFPMAGHLQSNGFDVCVYNRTTSKAESWQSQYGGRIATTPCAAAEGAELVFLCVGNDDDVRQVVYGESGILAGTSAGTLVVDHTTAVRKP